MEYRKLKETFRELNDKTPAAKLTAHIVFTEDSFDKPYPLISRSYVFTSDNKAFCSWMGGYSIFAYGLDGTDQGIRLDWYMSEEGVKDGWEVQDCYILEQMQDAAAIPGVTRTEQADGTVCYYFGETCIQARETTDEGKVRLVPLLGSQISDGNRITLPIDRVYGYCTLLTRHLNPDMPQYII